MRQRPTLTLVLQGILLFVISAALIAVIVFASDGFLDGDSYYHVQMAREIADQRSLVVDFPWLPLTILNANQYTDHHLLFHVYLIPFVAAAGINGAKIAMIAVVAGIVVAAWVLLRALQVRWAALWALGILALSSFFLLRITAVRTQGPSLLLLIVALALMFGRRQRWLILVAFANVWLYDGFVLLPAFAALYVLATWITTRRWELQALIYALVGTALGLVINPYFPRDIQFAFDHLIAKLNVGGNAEVGAEWYASSFDSLLRYSAGAFLVLIAGLLPLLFDRRRRDRVDVTLLLTALLTLVMTLIASRFIEYFPAFALLFCAATWGRGVELPAFVPTRLRRESLAVIVGAIVLVGCTAFYVRQARLLTVRETSPLNERAGASAWLSEYTPEGALVFNTRWSEFPRLFYQNPHNVYVSGLDPTYLQLAHPALATAYDAIRLGRADDPAAALRTDFGAAYVLMARKGFETALSDQLAADATNAIVYEDDDSIVWRVGSTSGES